MSNAIIVPASFNAPASAIFQGQQAGDDLSGGITGGYALLKYRGKVWSIQHNGNTLNLMRDDGDGPRGSVDIVILKANPQLSKTFYESGWDENNSNPPDCASANGIVPDAGVPKKQSDTCAMCKNNAWGSAPGGGKGKACGDHRRLAIVPLEDLRNETFGGPMLLRCPAASLQDMAAFDSRYKGMGYPYFTMGVKIAFDPVESYPKFTFQAIRPLSDEEGKVILEMRNGPETGRVVHETTAPAQAAPQVAPPQDKAFLEPAPAQTMVQQAPVQQVSPPVVQQPAPAQPAPVASVVEPAAPKPNGGGGFGAVSAVAPAAAASPPAAAPQRAMTGFGATQSAAPARSPGQAPAPAPEVTQTAPPAQPTQAEPGVVTAFEGSIDERLNKLLGE